MAHKNQLLVQISELSEFTNAAGSRLPQKQHAQDIAHTNATVKALKSKHHSKKVEAINHETVAHLNAELERIRVTLRKKRIANGRLSLYLD